MSGQLLETALDPNDSLLLSINNYNLQLTEDPKSKIARITVKDPAAPDPLVTKVLQLKFASPTNIVAAVRDAKAAMEKA